MDYENDLVTIIVPCFNGEKYVHRFFESLIKQTYKYIQLIFVNDGSVDGTREVFNIYDYLMRQAGIKTVYIEQINQGQAAAINSALPYVCGEFLMWMDSDDILLCNHIETKVNLLRGNANSIVMCKGIIVEEKQIEIPIGEISNCEIKERLFEKLYWGLCGCTGALFMVHTRDFFSEFQQKKIITSRVGQNLQILLPLLTKYSVGTINEKLFIYVNRDDSHSHSFKTYQERFNRIKDIEELKVSILKSIKDRFCESYYQQLNSVLRKIDLVQKLELLNEALDLPVEITKEIINEYRFYINDKKSRFWIWGACKKNEILAKGLEMYGNLNISGYIDSDDKKQGENVIAPSHVFDENDYLIIPLAYHGEIVSLLDERGMKSSVDYLYLAYDIKRGIEHDEESRNSNFPLC
ncbi:Glycosyltransferase involved in cell wall bisynthesis [Pseudobutyrivibrio sp. UC1225]|uniref:glycosyltransferase family A protein n=1 Tax=Pseudobutyrivibrio sp. UC1225 TaxID=1798185 RepID=UPI0008EE1873|nr:glycosyltransferase family 2 protein [Pseudobutyrivibrio sp. UC1225]SFO06939.1 Glycosyltransferase involved in cell wall bisynthesis [Pseudobutyrivibrio sp. UC1225]